ncbi:DUF547 domain-containing protein [Alteromonas sp. KUL42]|nr:DUF547 domain-containing protein [Alteromonas sp. KUL42]GEA06386.1 DUF547 domain-containing protein [Alteromonas sp. KUL42]
MCLFSNSRLVGDLSRKIMVPTHLLRKIVISKQKSILLVCWLSFFASCSFANENLHSGFDSLLRKHVITIDNGASTQVDYAGFMRDKPLLDDYLSELTKVEQTTFDSWSDNHQLAFLINAYNAHTIALILTEYPDITSIRDLGSFFSSPWKKEIAPLLGEIRTLDDIEHNLIRGDNKYQEPRIHFAVNCASIGCPALREESYTGEKLETQLQGQTERFLADKTRNYVLDDTLYLSKIFSWYGDDFEQGWQGAHSVKAFIGLYSDALGLSEMQANKLISGDMSISFNEYDWRLNDITQ